MLRGHRDVIAVGVYDPQRRSPPSRWNVALRAALERFGPVVVHEREPFFVGVAGVTTVPNALDDASTLVVIDGYLTAPGDLLELADHKSLESTLAQRYTREGPAFVASLQGAFSLMCWDGTAGRGLLARDQLGQRPMFVAERGPQLYFATEIRPLIDLLPGRPAPNPTAVARYLAPSELRDDLILYEGIERVGNGELVELFETQWRRRAYWRPVFREPHPRSSAEIADEARDQISRAISRHTRGAVNFGVFLSGGLDSTCVAALALKQFDAEGKALRAYSAVFPEHEPVDESEQITAVVDHLRLPTTRLEVVAGSSLEGMLETLDAWRLTELTANGFFMRRLSRVAVEDGIEVMLGGEGGDEIFAAPTLAIADRLSRADVRGALGLLARFPNVAYHPSRRLRMGLLRDHGIYPLLPYLAQRELVRRGERAKIPEYLAPGWADRIMETIDPRPWRTLDGPRWWRSQVDQFVRRGSIVGASELILRSARLCGMIHRHPLLDVQLVEWALTVPPEENYDPERSRPVLRRAMSGLVPDSVRLRPQKVTFDAVRGLSLLDDRQLIKSLLEHPRSRIRAYTRPDVVQGLLDQAPRTWPELSVWSGYVMRLIAIECWLRLQEDDGFARRLIDEGGFTPTVLTTRR